VVTHKARQALAAQPVAAIAQQATSVEVTAAELLKTIVTSLGQTGSPATGEPRRLFFPDGINLISLSVNVGSAKVELRISSDAKTPPTAPSSVVALSATDSCRHSLLFRAGDDLSIGEKVPASAESVACGPIKKPIRRGDPEFSSLVQNSNPSITYKDEEGTGADRTMSKRLSDRLDGLAKAVEQEWPGTRLRVTEAWDEDDEHSGNSLHYEGRAADLTTDPIDGGKLGRLGRLAVEAGCDWVWYENAGHVHVSVKA
jgi:hypothetical protein